MAALTLTEAVADTEPFFAVTTNVPDAPPAVNKPVASIALPAPVTVHVHAGCTVIGLPNWSVPAALNCHVPPPAATDGPACETAIAVNVWFTVTLTLLVVVDPIA